VILTALSRHLRGPELSLHQETKIYAASQQRLLLLLRARWMDDPIRELQNACMGTSTRRDRPWGFDVEKLDQYRKGAYALLARCLEPGGDHTRRIGDGRSEAGPVPKDASCPPPPFVLSLLMFTTESSRPMHRRECAILVTSTGCVARKLK